jgi:Flp pilus assembly pilin Flp
MVVDKSESWPERRQRHAVRLQASVTTSGGRSLLSDVTDLSLDGCRLTGQFKIGELLQLKIPRIGTHTAEVRWTYLGRSGVRFIRSSPGLATDKSGAAAIEYAILASLIALALAGALFNLGGSVGNTFQRVDQEVASGIEYNTA